MVPNGVIANLTNVGGLQLPLGAPCSTSSGTQSVSVGMNLLNMGPVTVSGGSLTLSGSIQNDNDAQFQVGRSCIESSLGGAGKKTV